MQVSSRHFRQDFWNSFWKNSSWKFYHSERFSPSLLGDCSAREGRASGVTLVFDLPRLLVSCSRLHESPWEHCPCCFPLVAVSLLSLTTLRAPLASSIHQCLCLGSIVSGTQNFDSVLSDPRTSSTSSSTSDSFGERPSARCPDRTKPILC